MSIIKIIVIVTFLVIFVNTLSHKWGLFNWLSSISHRFRYKFFYSLFNCEFCMNFHFAWILTIGVLQFFTFEHIYLLVPFCVSGLISMWE